MKPIILLLLCAIILTGLFLEACARKKDKKTERDIMSQLPTELVSNAKEFLDSNTKLWHVTTLSYSKWLIEGEVISITDEKGNYVVYWINNNSCYKLNGDDGIGYINEIISYYGFIEKDFEDVAKVEKLLNIIVILYRGPYRTIASKALLRMEEGLRLDFLGRSERNENVLKKLFADPLVNENQGCWEVSFNVLNSDGSVDKWEVSGRHDQGHITITDIETEMIEKAGSFTYPLSGDN